MAQLLHRGTSTEKRAMQALQTGSDGHEWQTAHWLGSIINRLGRGFCRGRVNTLSAYHC